MFTGIVNAIGTIRETAPRGDLRATIACPYDPEAIAIGASIACSGVCLTVVDKGEGWFAADVSHETESRTAPGMWTAGARLNLERALKVGDELGGHIVTGHVDGVGAVANVVPVGDSREIAIRAPAALGTYIAEKGSITVDGVSLTVSAIGDAWFEISLIPTTLSETTLGTLAVGDIVNLETDVIAKYVERMTAPHTPDIAGNE